MCRQFSFFWSARNGGNNDCRAEPIARVVGYDKYGSCAALLRADNGIKLCVVDVATLYNSIHSVLTSYLDLGRYVAARHKEAFKVGRA